MSKKNNQTFSSGSSPYPSSSALALPSLLALHGAPALGGGLGLPAGSTHVFSFLSCVSNADKMKSRCKPGMASCTLCPNIVCSTAYKHNIYWNRGKPHLLYLSF